MIGRSNLTICSMIPHKSLGTPPIHIGCDPIKILPLARIFSGFVSNISGGQYFSFGDGEKRLSDYNPIHVDLVLGLEWGLRKLMFCGHVLLDQDVISLIIDCISGSQISKSNQNIVFWVNL